MKIRYRITALLLAGMVMLAICSCGASDNTFTVDYVASAGVLNSTVIIVGQYKGEEAKLDVGHAFKDCTFTGMDFVEENPTLSGTEEGYLKYEGGVILTLTDADGQTHTVEVKEGSKFKLEELDDGWRLLLPD